MCVYVLTDVTNEWTDGRTRACLSYVCACVRVCVRRLVRARARARARVWMYVAYGVLGLCLGLRFIMFTFVLHSFYSELAVSRVQICSDIYWINVY